MSRIFQPPRWSHVTRFLTSLQAIVQAAVFNLNYFRIARLGYMTWILNIAKVYTFIFVYYYLSGKIVTIFADAITTVQHMRGLPKTPPKKTIWGFPFIKTMTARFFPNMHKVEC